MFVKNLFLIKKFNIVRPVSIKILEQPFFFKIKNKELKSFLFFKELIKIIFIPFFLKNKIFFLFFELVNKKIFLLFFLLKRLRFFFILRSLSIIARSGLLFSKPLILQSSIELSSLIDLDVEIIQLYLDLSKCDLFLE